MLRDLNTILRGDGCASWVAPTERTNIPIVYLLINTMPTASTAKKTTTPRKRRTRKTSTTPLNKSVTKQVVTEVRGSKVSSKSVAQTNTAPVRPAKPNLTWEDYRADAIVRWNIHSYEVNELGKDLVKGYQLVKQHAVQVVNYTKESYNKAFN